MLVEVAKRVAAVLLYMGIVAVVPFLLRSNAVVHHRQGGLIPHSTLLLFVATTTSAWSWPPNLRPPLPLGLRSSKSGSRSGGGGWVRQALHLRRRHPLGAWQQQPSSSRRFHTMAPNNKAAKQRAMAAAASSMDDDDNNEPSTIDPTPPLPALKRSSSRKSATRVVDDDPAAIQNDDVPEPKKKQQRVSRSKKDAVAVPAIAMVEEEKAIDDKNDTTAPKEKRTKAPGHQIFTERDPLPKLWTSDQAVANGSYSKFWKLLVMGKWIST